MNKDREPDLEYKKWMLTAVKNTFPKFQYSWMDQRLTEIVKKYQLESYIGDVDKFVEITKKMFIDQTNYICTVFRAFRESDSLVANYAYMYSVDPRYTKGFITADPGESPKIIMYCVSPALMSADGEYRYRTLNYTQLQLLEKLFPKIYNEIETIIVKKIESESVSLEYENFYPQLEIEKAVENIDSLIVDNRLLIKFLIHYWFVEIYRIHLGIQENHVNPKFNKLFFKDLTTDLAAFRDMMHRYGSVIIDAVSVCDMPVKTKTTENKVELEVKTIPLGQKLRPLNVSEVQEPFNIKYPAWREVHLSKVARDLVSNLICPSFPIIVDWFYIKNSKRGLFDNEQQYKRVEFSERANVIVHKLRETQRLTYGQDLGIKKYLNDLFKEAHDKMEPPIDYIKANLMMSNVTLGIIAEYVGHTYYDIPNMITSPVWVKTVGDILGDTDVFKKYIWDICYAILCLNVKCGISHSDLHLNNVTINIPHEESARSNDLHALYSALGFWFVIPNYPAASYIIDFSRGVVVPDNVKNYAYFRDNHDEFQLFVWDQNDRIINKLEEYFPTMVKLNREKLQQLLNNDFVKIWKVYTAIDTYEFCSKLRSHLRGKTVSGNTDLLNKIVKISEHYLVNIMVRVINTPDMIVEWPVFQIMKECFSDYIIDPAIDPDKQVITSKSNSKKKGSTEIKISDIWILDRPLKYNFERLSDFPPFIKDQCGMRADGTIYQLKTNKDATERRVKYEQYRDKSLDMVFYIAERHKKKYQ